MIHALFLCEVGDPPEPQLKYVFFGKIDNVQKRVQVMGRKCNKKTKCSYITSYLRERKLDAER